MNRLNIEDAVILLQSGKLLAYPTEAVYGLGCDPFNQRAVFRLLALKQRKQSQGLILIIADWAQLEPLIALQEKQLLDRVRNTWPGPYTWIFPKSDQIPEWISGAHDGVAIRMTAHPVARELCRLGPIVSTSANLSGRQPALNLEQLEQQFPEGIDAVVEGGLGAQAKPSGIYELLTGKCLR